MRIHPAFRYVPWFFLLSLVLIVGAILFYANKTIIGYVSYPLDYSVGDYEGFNLDTDAIHFGTSPPQVVVKRKVYVETPQDAIIHAHVYGVNYLTLDKTDFMLRAGNSTVLTLTLSVPEKTPAGYHQGKLLIVYKKPYPSS